MKIITDGTILICGKVSHIAFYADRESVLVEFSEEGGYTFEFNNRNKKRAEHIRKLRIHEGDAVLAIGKISKGSAIRVFGYELLRSGKVSQGSYAIVKGEVKNCMKMKNANILFLNSGKQNFVVSACEETAQAAKTGCEIALPCHVENHLICDQACTQFGMEMCRMCAGSRMQKRYMEII